MPPSIDELLARYDDPYRKSERIEIGPERFEKGVARGDDGAWGVGALVVQDGCGILVREGDVWLLPGGRLEATETPEVGARREVREETGVGIDIAGLGAVAEQTFVRRGSGDSYEFTFVTFVATPAAPDPQVPTIPDDPSIDEIAWRSEIPENTFDRDLVHHLFDAYV